MNVKELRSMLDKYPDDMEIVNRRCSDWDLIKESEWGVVKAVPQTGVSWLMRSHPTMSQENKDKEKEYLALEGN